MSMVDADMSLFKFTAHYRPPELRSCFTICQSNPSDVTLFRETLVAMVTATAVVAAVAMVTVIATVTMVTAIVTLAAMVAVVAMVTVIVMVALVTVVYAWA